MKRISSLTEAEKRAYYAERRRKGRIWKWAGDHVRVAVAVGVLVRPDACETCGRTDSKIEAAHHDYTKPLDVRFLCLFCHRSWDAVAPKTPTHDLIPSKREAWWGVR